MKEPHTKYPLLKTYREFVADHRHLYYPIEELNEAESKMLIDRIELIEQKYPEEYAYDFERFMATARVVEWRRFDDTAKEVVIYEGDKPRSMRIMVSYWVMKHEVNVSSFCFFPEDPEPMQFVVETFEDETTSRPEVAMDRYWHHWRGNACKIRPKGGSSEFEIWTEWEAEYGETPLGTYARWSPYGLGFFSMRAKLFSVDEGERLMMTVLEHGFEAGLASVVGWTTDCGLDNSSVHVSDFLAACRLRLKRHGLDGSDFDHKIEAAGITCAEDLLLEFHDTTTSVPVKGVDWNRWWNEVGKKAIGLRNGVVSREGMQQHLWYELHQSAAPKAAYTEESVKCRCPECLIDFCELPQALKLLRNAAHRQSSASASDDEPPF